MWSAWKHHRPFLVAVIFVIALALFTRFYHLGTAPAGVTWDEAALGYVGKMVIQTGRDEYGHRLPITFTSFGDYKSPLAFYLTGLSTLIFGVTPWATRLPFALAGVGSILLMMWLTWRIWREPWLALLSGFLLTTLPWHFLFSRVGFEVGLVLFAWLAQLISWREWHMLTPSAPRWRRLIWPALFGFTSVLSLYTYHAAKIVIPLIWLAILFYDWLDDRQWVWKQRTTLAGLTIGTGLLSLPLLWDMVAGPGVARAGQTTILGTLPWLPTLVQIIRNLAQHLSLNFLLWGETTTLRHGTPDFGVFLFPQLIFFWLGLTFLLGRVLQRGKPTKNLHSRWRQFQVWLGLRSQPTTAAVRPWFWLLLLLLALLPAAIGREIPHANRALLAIAPSILLMVAGIRELRAELDQRSFASIVGSLILLLILQFSVFWQYYFTQYQVESGEAWLVEQAPAVQLAQEYQQAGQHVKFTDHYGQPLIFFAFYNQLPPETYRQFRLPGIDFGPVKVEDVNTYDVILAAPDETVPGEPLQIITRPDGSTAFAVYAGLGANGL